MNINSLLPLIAKKYKTLLLFVLLGLVFGGFLAINQKEEYQTGLFVSFGASWFGSADYSAQDSVQATEYFAEKMMGIIKGGSFDSELDEKIGFDAECGVSTFEKGNILITCETDNEVRARNLPSGILAVLESILQQYNLKTGEKYAIGNTNEFFAEITPSNSRIIVMSAGIALILFLVLVFFLLR